VLEGTLLSTTLLETRLLIVIESLLVTGTFLTVSSHTKDKFEKKSLDFYRWQKYIKSREVPLFSPRLN
jgi:hypothetical protein